MKNSEMKHPHAKESLLWFDIYFNKYKSSVNISVGLNQLPEEHLMDNVK